jgi:hypothetical protein
VTVAELKPNKILCCPLFAEPVEVIVTVPMGNAVKLVGRGIQSGKVVDIVLHCATTPSLNIFQDPATLDWQPIVKVEHYRLRQDSPSKPVELREDSPPYRV